MGSDDLGGRDTRQPKAHQHKTVEHIVGVAVASHDVAVRTDRSGPGKGSAGKIKRAELARDQQIAMANFARDIPSGDVAASVEPGGVGVGRARTSNEVISPSLNRKPWVTPELLYTPEMSP